MAGEQEAGRTQAPEQTSRESEQTPQAPEPAGPGQAAEQTAGAPAEQAAGQTAGEPAERAGEPAERAAEQTPQAPGFGERGRMRRRARFLRRARELAYRDLGGLVFDLHRFGQRNDRVVLAKLATLAHIDAELRALEEALHDLRPVTVLREVGIAACPRCAAIHGSDDRFCPGCGLAFDTSADRPLSTAPITPPAPSAEPAPAPAPAQPATPPAAPADLSEGRPAAAPAERPVGRPATAPPEPALPVKPTAAPVAARPTREPEDEPTQIVRPPARGA